jgi:galactonate dehydratase
MKITEVKTFMVNARRQNWIFVKVLTDEGLYGWGEASVEGQELAAEQAIHVLAERSVIGEDPRNVDYIWQKMYRHGFWKSGFIYNTAISGIDQAIWDIKGKMLGVPVYELLGGKVRDKIRTYTHGGPFNAEKCIEMGFAGIKTGIGPNTEVTDNRYAAAKQFAKVLEDCRKLIGEDAVIAVDHHGQSNVRDALALIEAAKDYNLHFFEEPITPENAQLYRTIHDNPYNVPIAAGERLYSRFDYREIIANQWLDIIQPDICHCGGISEIRKIGYMAEPYMIKFAPHSPNGPVATAASIQVAAAVQNFDILEFAQTVYLCPDIYDIDLKPVDGYFKIPTKPGLGIELDEEAFAKYPYQNFQYRPRYRADGGVAEI